MRTMCLTVLAAAVLGLTGCGGGGAEAATKDSIAAMNALTAALKAGDKAGVKKAADELKAVTDKMKAIKVTESENKRLKAKYEGEIKAASEEMAKAMFASMGKFSLDDMKEIGEILKAAGK